MITEIKKSKRSSTSVQFYNESGSAIHAAVAAAGQTFIDAGKVTVNETLSDDGLTKTYTTTFADLETYGQVDSLKTVAMDLDFLDYVGSHGFPLLPDHYVQTGIEQPFDHIITYSFPEGATNADGEELITAIPAAALSNYVSDVNVTATSVAITYRFNNSTEFTQNHFNDLPYLTQWPNVSRTLSYQLV
jgi:hypothetical protein